MSFGSDPGRDDGSLPPVNVRIPDDARELERDVIAYRRELRARRRQARFARLARPLRGRAALLPLLAACVAIAVLAGTMLSLVTISPASAPTLPPVSPPSSPARPVLQPPRSCWTAANALIGAAPATPPRPGAALPPCAP